MVVESVTKSMELFPIAPVCQREGIPWRAFQSITDHADRDSGASWQVHVQAGRRCFWNGWRRWLGKPQTADCPRQDEDHILYSLNDRAHLIEVVKTGFLRACISMVNFLPSKYRRRQPILLALPQLFSAFDLGVGPMLE